MSRSMEGYLLFLNLEPGLTTDASDIDVAIMFEKVPDFYELTDLQEQLSSHVEEK